MLKNRPLFFSLFLFLSVMMSGCATSPKRPAISIQREAYLKDICARNNVQWQWDHISQVATLRHKGVKAKVLVGSDLVLIGENRITLSAPVRTVQSAVIVPTDFQFKVIDVLRRKADRQKGRAPSQIRTIIIDAGHGGKDPGAIGRTGVQEKGIVLDISRRLKKLLQSRGFTVQMTRKKDEFISLEKRTEMTSRHADADLFVSVHANSSPVRSIQGLEVFTAKNLGFKERNEKQRKTNQKLLFKKLSMKNGAFEVEKIVADMLYAHKEAESKLLATRLARQTAKFTRTKNRGMKKSRFFVLRNTLIPAILVEVGFLTNPKEEKLLQTSTYRQRIAVGLADSISSYANGQ